MTASKHLLIVAHQPSSNTRVLAEAVLRGASDASVSGTETRLVAPLESDENDVFWADAIILGTPENFGYMSGALKDFFDRIYYPCLEKTEAMPYALYIRAGLDGTGTKRAVENIVGGMKWKRVQDTMILQGGYQAAFEAQCQELGLTLAASLEAGIV